MNNPSAISSKKTIINVFGCLLILMTIGSFADFQISSALFDLSNPFGIIFAAYGEYPASLGMVCAASLMLCKRAKNNYLNILKTIGCILLVAMGTFMACFTPTLYLSISNTIVYIIGAICSITAFIVTKKITSHTDPDTANRIGLILFSVIFSELIIVNIVKIPWGRARMRLVAEDSRAYFMPWWQLGDSLKNELVPLGVAAEEFKSFPSGHTANAAVLLLLPLLSDLAPSLKGKEKVLFSIGVG